MLVVRVSLSLVVSLSLSFDESPYFIWEEHKRKEKKKGKTKMLMKVHSSLSPVAKLCFGVILPIIISLISCLD